MNAKRSSFIVLVLGALAGSFTQAFANAPTITQNPQDQHIYDGQVATFTVTATGSAPLSYQWQKLLFPTTTYVTIPGASSSTYYTQVGEHGMTEFRCVVTNPAGSVTSGSGTLFVSPAPPTITQQPQGAHIFDGEVATFTVTAIGSPPLSYQWQKLPFLTTAYVDIPGATSSYVYATSADKGLTQFRCLVTNPVTTVISVPATLIISPVGPTITQNPQDQHIYDGQVATFTVTATGSAPLSYQWEKLLFPTTTYITIPGASSSTYYTQVGEHGNTDFRCVVTNPVGSVTSGSGKLLVSQLPPTITSSSTVLGQVGWELGYTITATQNPTSFSASGLPAGLHLFANGLIDGFPVSSGTTVAIISATNAVGTSSAPLTITVAGPVISPSISLSSGSVTAGQAVTLDVNFSTGSIQIKTITADFTLPTGGVFATAYVGPAGSAANKRLSYQSLGANRYHFSVFGNTEDSISSGLLATVQIQMSSAPAIGVWPVVLSSPTFTDIYFNDSVPGSASNGSVIVTPTPFSGVSITSLNHGNTVSGTVNVLTNITTGYTTIFKVEFYVNNALAYTSSGFPYSYAWNTTALPNGSTFLMAKAYDTSGSVTSHTIAVNVSHTGVTPVPLLPSRVTVSGSRLMLEKRQADGTLAAPVPYIIKGVTWSPATLAPHFGPDLINPSTFTPYGFFFDWNGRNPQGHVVQTEWTRTRFLSHDKTDLDLMQQMNINTVRIYQDLGTDPLVYKQVLDECYAHGIMVIMTVAISKDEITTSRYVTAVNLAKNHPAILMWSIGNEWNLNSYYGYTTMSAATAATEQVAQAILALDSNHPVTSSLGDRFTLGSSSCGSDPAGSDVPTIVANVPSVSIWGMNVYRGPSFGTLFTQWQAASSKPFYLSEMGTDSFASTSHTTPPACQGVINVTGGSENQATQATFDLGLWNEIKPNLSAIDVSRSCVGAFVHEFNDSIWKVGNFNAGLGGLVNYDGPDHQPNTADDDHSFDVYNPDGFLFSAGHPDGVSNEEYYGMVTADRQPKTVFQTLKNFYGQLAVTGVNQAPTVAQVPAMTPVENPLAMRALLTVLGADDAGEGNLTYTWNIPYPNVQLRSFYFDQNNVAHSIDSQGTNGAKLTAIQFYKSGVYDIPVTITDAAGASITVPFQVTASQIPTSFVITPSSKTLNPGATQQFTAIAYDQWGSSMTVQPTLVWSASSGTVISNTGLFTAGATLGAYTVTVSTGTGGKTGSASVFVVSASSNQPPTVAQTPAMTPVESPFAARAILTVLGADDAGEGNLTYTWNVPYSNVQLRSFYFDQNNVPRSVDPQGTNGAKLTAIQFYKSGVYDIPVTITDASGASITVPFQVTASQIPSSYVMTPSSITLNPGGVQQFTAVAYDQWGNLMSPQPSLVWTVSGGGAISNTGLFISSGTLGAYTINVSTGAGGRTGTATVFVVSAGGNQAPTVAQAPAMLPSMGPHDGHVRALLTVLGADDAGEGNLTYAWNVPYPNVQLRSIYFDANDVAHSVAPQGTNGAKLASIQFYKSGVYDISVTITDASGASITVPIQVTAGQIPTSFVLTPSSITLNPGALQQFTALVYDQWNSSMTVQPTLAWSVSGGGAISNTGLFISSGSIGTYTVSVSTGAGGKIGSAQVFIVNPNSGLPPPLSPTPPALSTIPDSASVNDMLRLDVSGQPADSVAYYEWTLTALTGQGVTRQFSGNGSSASGIGVITIRTTEPALNLKSLGLDGGRYLITVIAVDVHGIASAPAQKTITLVALAGYTASDIRVYPSPWRADQHNGRNLTFDQMPNNATVKIFTIAGHWVATLSAPAGSVQWDLKNNSGDSVASGIYFYLITDNQDGKSRGKIVIIR